MTSESYLLQFCYQCDLKGPIGDSFEVLKKRIQWNFESYLEDVRRKNRELTKKVWKTNDFQIDSKSSQQQKTHGHVRFYRSFKASLTVQTVVDEMKWNKSQNTQKKYRPNLQNFKSENPPIVNRQFKQNPDNFKTIFKMCQK